MAVDGGAIAGWEALPTKAATTPVGGLAAGGRESGDVAAHPASSCKVTARRKSQAFMTLVCVSPRRHVLLYLGSSSATNSPRASTCSSCPPPSPPFRPALVPARPPSPPNCATTRCGSAGSSAPTLPRTTTSRTHPLPLAPLPFFPPQTASPQDGGQHRTGEEKSPPRCRRGPDPPPQIDRGPWC